MVLFLSATQMQQMHQHAEGSYPNECCGLLLGAPHPHQDGVSVSEVWSLRNAWDEDALKSYGFTQMDAPDDAHSRSDRYWIDPKDLLLAQRYARDHQIQVVGIYHSHPDHPARPSECDRQLAWTAYMYLILSVQQGHVCDVLSWTLNSQQQFQSDPLIIQDEMAPAMESYSE